MIDYLALVIFFLSLVFSNFVGWVISKFVLKVNCPWNWRVLISSFWYWNWYDNKR